MPALHQTRALGKHQHPLERSEGFTLLELLVVLVILGILSAIAIPAYNHYINAAKITTAVATLNEVRKNLESYYIDYQDYPAAIDFSTGEDGLGRTVFQPPLVNQINRDLSSIDSYTSGAMTYTLVVKANDSKQAVMTLTPLDITY